MKTPNTLPWPEGQPEFPGDAAAAAAADADADADAAAAADVDTDADADADADAPFRPVNDDTGGMYVDVHSFGGQVIFPYGFENRAPGNLASFMAISHKISSVNGYYPSGSGYNFLGRTSGDTLDWHYGALGVASILFELGSAWAQPCSSFETEVLPQNLEALLYTTKLAMTPYRTAMGPDVLSLRTARLFTFGGGPLATVRALVSDKAMTVLPRQADLASGDQRIDRVWAYVDSHPYDANPPPPRSMVPLDGSLDSPSEEVAVTFDLSGLANPGGRHTVCVMATDADGYNGPVTCAYIEGFGGDISADAITNSTAAGNSTSTVGNSPLLWTQKRVGDGDYEEVPSNETSPSCLGLDSEQCAADPSCRWREEKHKCMEVCQRRTTRDNCEKAKACTWDGDGCQTLLPGRLSQENVTAPVLCGRDVRMCDDNITYVARDPNSLGCMEFKPCPGQVNP